MVEPILTRPVTGRPFEDVGRGMLLPSTTIHGTKMGVSLRTAAFFPSSSLDPKISSGAWSRLGSVGLFLKTVFSS